jgi:hypothetical protein
VRTGPILEKDLSIHAAISFWSFQIRKRGGRQGILLKEGAKNLSTYQERNDFNKLVITIEKKMQELWKITLI